MAKIEKVYVFDNGMVMVFDARGQQMPEYQGRAVDVLDRIKRDAPSVPIRRGEVR